MLRRFAAGSLVACIAIAVATLAVLAVFQQSTQRVSLILAAWCIVPCVWGLWAMLTPLSWVPQRLPIWGAGLGAVAGVMALFVLNLPWRVFEASLPVAARAVGVIVAAAFYYAMWMIVETVYMRLTPRSS